MGTQNESPASAILQQARVRVLEAVRVKPHSVAELADAFGRKPVLGDSKAQRKELASQAIGTLLAEGEVYEHPIGGRNRSVRYSTSPADPQKYVTKTSLKQLQATYQKLVRAKVTPAAIIAAAAGKLEPSVRLTATPGEQGADGLSEAIVGHLRELFQQHPSQNCPLPELYRSVAEGRGVSVGAFHDCLRRLWDEKRIRLVVWSQPLYTMEDDRFALIVDQEIRYYARIP